MAKYKLLARTYSKVLYVNQLFSQMFFAAHLPHGKFLGKPEIVGKEIPHTQKKKKSMHAEKLEQFSATWSLEVGGVLVVRTR